MDKIVIQGNGDLQGVVRISGSKNASLPILAATLLTREPCIISRVPDVSDTNYMLQILSSMGAKVERASGRVIIEADAISSQAAYDQVRKMRASICVLGPLLAREGRAVVALPGGCVIGDRPIDLHVRAMEALGATSCMEKGNVIVEAKELRGSEISLRGKHGSTVLGTDNLMMAATLAKGTTIIEGAAAEPEVVDLANFLNAMGAKVQGAGTRRIVIEGVDELHGVEHEVIPDRIEAGTFLVAGAMASPKGITLRRVHAPHLESVIKSLRGCGAEIEEPSADTLLVRSASNPKPQEILTEPYPGFPTDMQAQMCALFATTPGISVVTETIFPQRFMHLSEMKRMGAQVQLEGATAIIRGVDQLSGAPVMASDLRASAALLLAGLRAEGQTVVHRVYHIDRGYEHIDEKLFELGADIRRERE